MIRRPPPSIDTVPPVGEHPAVQAATANLRRLLDQLREAEQRVQALEHGIAVARSGSSRPRDEIHLSAVALLEGGDPQAPAGDVAVSQELNRRRAQRRALEEAVRLAQQVVENARVDASVVACRTLAPTYRELVDRQTAALLECARAGMALEGFEDALRAKGLTLVPGILPPVRVDWPGRLDRPGAAVRVYLRELEAAGFELPVVPEIAVGEARQRATAAVRDRARQAADARLEAERKAAGSRRRVI